jgi:putative membrane-bound dehydrogenase-like protein
VDGNRLTYLDEPANPYSVHRDFPKLTTPMWVGEEGVEAVVILGIDDMRGHEKWETYLRPILNRLKKVDGRAPVSIMTCSINPNEPHLQTWLKEGLSLECHTIDHPCPLLKDGDFAKAKSTYDRCVDLMFSIPNNRPVAFRTPCCDSLNTNSPRMYAEILAKTPPLRGDAKQGGNFLHIDTSVFHLFSANDPALPRELVLDADGRERFRKYIPYDRSFVNLIEDYPYPYVIGRTCWEFPCMTPSDWQAQHLHKPNNPVTVRDWQAALDCTVLKQGVFCLVFHPHNWIKPEQVIDLIDHAQTKHGKKVKFLTFKEALERLNKNLLVGQALRVPRGKTHHHDGGDNGVRLIDMNDDGYMDVVIGGGEVQRTRLWSTRMKRWIDGEFPVGLAGGSGESGVRFGVLSKDGFPTLISDLSGTGEHVWRFDGKRWLEEKNIYDELARDPAFPRVRAGTGVNTIPYWPVCFRDLDRDGRCELIAGAEVYRRSTEENRWIKLGFGLPPRISLLDEQESRSGLRFIDLNDDGYDDIVFSNEERYGIWLFESMEKGWSKEIVEASQGRKPPVDGQKEKQDHRGLTPPARQSQIELPPITINGANNGFFVHSRHLWWQNEHTALLKDHMDRRSFAELLKDVQPGPKSPEQSLKCIQCRPGFTADLVAAEPLVADPIAFAFGADGKLWVVEMGDYPLGVNPSPPTPLPKGERGEKTAPSPPAPLPQGGEGKKKGGGRVRYLEDVDGDGKYDKATIFLDGLAFPTGVMPWRKGVLVTCAPDIFYAEDTDGDGKADKRQVLLTGFKEGNQQHRVNGLTWGLDGWVYGANGDSGGTIKPLAGFALANAVPNAKPQAAINISGRDFRFKPDTGEFEPVTGQTQFGRCRDDWGNWFGGNNANPLWHLVLEDRYLKRNPHFAPPNPRVDVPVTPGQSPVYPISRTLPRFNDLHTANRFTSACSPTFNRDDLFGPHFANNVFICEPVHNLVSRMVLTPEGVTFKGRRAPGEERSEFLASTDNWFRPVFAQTGPDGALWVADMYRHVIEHPEWIPKETQKTLDLRAGHDKGRIYRVYPVDMKPRAIPRLDKLDTAGLVAAIDSPNGWQRDMAQMMLVWRCTHVPDASVQTKEAVPVLETIVRTSRRPEARVQALCTLDNLDALRGDVHAAALKDAHPGVRKHGVRLIHEYKPFIARGFDDVALYGDFSSLLHRLAVDADAHVRMQLAYTLGGMNRPEVSQSHCVLLRKSAGDRFLTAAALSSINAKNLEPILKAVLAEERANPRLLGELLRIAHGLGQKKAVLTCLAALKPPGLGFRLKPAQLESLAALLDALEERGSSLAQVRQEFGGDKDALTVLDALHDYFFAAREFVKDEKATPADKLIALRLLGRGVDEQEQDLKRLAELLQPASADALQVAAVQAISRVQSLQGPVHLLAGWKSHSPTLRNQILEVLLRRPEGTAAVLAGLEQKTMLAVDLSAVHRQRLLEHKDSEVHMRAAKLFAGTIDKDRQKLIDAYRPVLTMKGDAVKGQPLFVKHCAACHKLAGFGTEIGPDLAALKDKSPTALLEAILDPNRAVEARYVSYVATTQNGLTLTGLLHTETSNSITLVGTDGKPQTILRTNLERLQSTGKSAMPDGLEKDLSPEQMADLLAFLTTSLPQPRRKEFVGNQPELVKPDANGVLKLSAENAEIYGTGLVFEAQFSNLGWWTKEDDHAVWALEVPKAGKYTIQMNYACHDSAAGDSFLLRVGDSSQTHRVAGTGAWENYKQIELGTIELSAGRHRVVMQSAGPIKSALIDLRSLRLVPALT